MAGVSELKIGGKKILVVDYSGCKEPDLFKIFDLAKSAIVAANEPCLVLNNFANTYLTSAFVRYVEEKIVKDLILKNAFIGMNNPKKMILKGINFLLERDFRAFDTEQQAVDYLVQETV